MKVKRFEIYESRKTGAKIRVKSVLGTGDVALVTTLDANGRAVRDSSRLLFVDSIRRKYQRT